MRLHLALPPSSWLQQEPRVSINSEELQTAQIIINNVFLNYTGITIIKHFWLCGDFQKVI